MEDWIVSRAGVENLVEVVATAMNCLEQLDAKSLAVGVTALCDVFPVIAEAEATVWECFQMSVTEEDSASGATVYTALAEVLQVVCVQAGDPVMYGVK
jgi:hypothetical protein